MLRHIRMTSRADPYRIPTKIFVTLRDTFRALYPLAIPHRIPKIGEPDPICHCRYPIFTLCTPEPSPYDLTSSGSGAAAARSCAVVSAATAEAVTEEINATAGMGEEASDEPLSSAGSSTSTAVAAAAAAAGVLAGTSKVGDDSAKNIFSGALPSSGHPHHNKMRPALRVRKLWRGRARPEVYQPNVVPNRPTCYRCDICDGFQDVAEDEDGGAGDGETGSQVRGETLAVRPAAQAMNGVPAARTLASAPMGRTSAESKTPTRSEMAEGAEEEEEVDEEEEEDDDDEFAGRPVSTDITNTIMPDAEIAELRYSDPFLVEVLGRPNVSAVSRKFTKHFMAQMARCNITAKDLAKKASRMSAKGAYYSTVYENWIRQQQQDKTRAARDRRRSERSGTGGDVATANNRVDYLTDKVDLLDRACYSVRFALAAYGLAYELGYLNSVADVMKMQAEPHRRYTCATSEEQMESMRRMLQGEEPNELMEFAASRYSIAIGKPCYAVVLDHEARRVVLTFRGSLTMADAVVDVTEGYAEVDLLTDGGKGVVAVEAGLAKAAVPLAKLSPQKQRRYGDKTTQGSSGATGSSSAAEVTKGDTALNGEDVAVRVKKDNVKEGECALRASLTTETPSPRTGDTPHARIRTRVPLGFYEAVREAAVTLLPALRTIYSQYSDYELFITGHSLGAIEANLFHLLYCFPASTAPVPFRKVQTYGFGGAPVVEMQVTAELNAALAAEEAATGSRLVNFSYGKDCITRLHVRGILQAMTEKQGASESASLPPQPRASLASIAAEDADPVPSNPTTPGSHERRKRRTAATGDPPMPDLDALPQLTLPGTCFNIPHSLRRGCFAVPLDCPWRSQLIFSVEAVYHHFPIHYARALNRLLHYYARRLSDPRAPSGNSSSCTRPQRVSG